jgi:hypothetical protein
MRFEHVDTAGHCSGGHTQLTRGEREAVQDNHAHERAHSLNLVHLKGSRSVMLCIIGHTV